MAQRIVDKTITLEELEGGEKAKKPSKAKAPKKEVKVKKPEELDAKLETESKTTSDENSLSEKNPTSKSVKESDTKVEKTEKSDSQEEQAKTDKSAKETEPKKRSTKKPKQKKVRSERYKKAYSELDKTKKYALLDAVKEVRKTATAKFTESVEIHINLGTDTQNTDHRIRFTTTLPHGIGKSITILVLSEDNSGKKGNILYRDKSAVDEIISCKLAPEKDFNVVVATTAAMRELAKAARVLGPKGLMPSPKTGTVTDTPEKAIESLSKGQLEIKSQPSHAVIHQIIGNLTFKDEALAENALALLTELNKNTPSKMKKKLIQNVYICSTMGPSVRVEY